MLRYYGSAHFDDGELLLRDGGKVVEILLDFSFGANLAEELNDSGASGERGVSGRGVSTA